MAKRKKNAKGDRGAKGDLTKGSKKEPAKNEKGQKNGRKATPDVLEVGLKQIIDPSVAHALSHPLRSHILATLGDRIASPREIAAGIGLHARDLDYHVKVLIGANLINLVRTEKRRGATEHFFEIASPFFYFDDGAWGRLPAPIRDTFSASLIRMIMDEAIEALRAGTFAARDSHQSRTPMIVDEEGWTEATELMDDTLAKLLEIRESSEKRCRARNEPGIPFEVALLGFQTAAAVDQAPGDGAPES